MLTLLLSLSLHPYVNSYVIMKLFTHNRFDIKYISIIHNIIINYNNGFFHWIKINNSNWADIISVLIGSVTSQWLGLSVGRSVGWVVGRSVLKGGKLHTYIHSFIQHLSLSGSNRKTKTCGFYHLFVCSYVCV